MLTLAAWPQAVPASDIVHTEVRHDNGVYVVDFTVSLAAQAERVRAVVTNYEALDQLSTTVKESRVLAVDGERVRLDLVLRPCVLLILCKKMRKVSDAVPIGHGTIRYRTVVSESDFAYADEQLTVRADPNHADHTLVTYHAELVPKFFVPPLVGPWLIRKQITSDLVETAQRVEAIASGADTKK